MTSTYNDEKALDAGQSKATFFLWLRGSGAGCDYTIGCGEILLPLPAWTSDVTAMAAAKHVLAEQYGDDPERLENMHALVLVLHATADHLVAGVASRCQDTVLAEDEAGLTRQAADIAAKLAAVRARRGRK